MEDIKQMIITNWPTIIEYFCMFVAYFLVFLYKSKVNATKNNLTTAFKEKMTVVNEKSRESKANYDRVTKDNESLRKRLDRLERTLNAFIGGSYEETSTITDKETNN